MTTRPTLRLSGVSLRRAGTPVLTGVDWTVCPGERWVVLGPNGSGKTTLLQVASAYERASAGEVAVLGERIGAVDVRRLRTRLGYASSALEPMVPPSTTVADLVVTGKRATLRRWTDRYDEADLARAVGLAQQMGLAAQLEQRFDTLSQGERRRAQLARALMADPELLLLDEPTANLDLGGREAVLDRLARLDGHGPEAIVMVTHHVEEIPAGFTHVALLREGAMVAAGPIETTLTAEALTECFATRLQLARRDGRYFAWRT